jgi:Ras-related protein Rab-8A
MVHIQVISTEKGQALADEYGIKFMETSAKNSINVDKAFITLAKDIKKRLIDNDAGGAVAQPAGTVRLDDKKEKPKPSEAGGCNC